MTELVSLERLKFLVTYDPITGSWTRNVSVGRHGRYRVGDPVGTINALLGYVIICIDYRQYYGHRLAWFYMTGGWPVDEIDHKNGIRSDNRWCNLREATKTENRRNVPAKKPRDLPKGVHRLATKCTLAKPYYARITVNHETIHLGYFASPSDAHDAYAHAAKKYHGEFARVA